MPYQPTNPYPYNTGVDLREGLTLQFKVDNYDTIIKFEIEIYDLFKNEKVYTIVREIGDISNSTEEKVLIEGDKQIIRIYDETDTLVYFDYYSGESVLPVVGGLSEESVCKIELTNYLKTIEQIQYEKYYNRVIDFTNFEITELSDSENPEASYYIFQKIETGDSYYIAGIKDEYKEYFNTLSKIVVPYQFQVINRETGTVQTQIIRGIGAEVFKDLGNLQEIILPSSLYEIGDNVFQNCTSLINVIFSYGLSKIGTSAFSGCSNLSSIELLDSIEELGNNCFEDCTSLTNLTISNSMEVISKNCFFNNSSLKNIKLKQIKILEEGAFANCFKLSNIEFSTILETIKTNAFQDCRGIWELHLPKNLKNIAKGAFNGCNNIVEIELPFVGQGLPFDEIDVVEEKEKLFGYIFGEAEEGGVVQYYSEIDSVSYAIPSSISKVILLNEEKISYGAFYDCEEIIEIILNEGITEIGEKAFYNCYNLTEIDIPSTVKSIGNNAFSLEGKLFEEVSE